MSMKSGASDDPFAEEEESDQEDGQQGDDVTTADQPSDHDSEASMESEPTTAHKTEQGGQQDLPYVVQRKLQNNPIQHERDRIPFYLRKHVLAGEKDFKRAVEETLEDDVPKADLREAAYIVAQRHVDEVVDELREMGYDWS